MDRIVPDRGVAAQPSVAARRLVAAPSDEQPLITPPHVLFVCTGNATRSVLAATYVARARPAWQVTSAGTMAIEGHYLSHRTLAAFAAVGLEPPRHRTRALTDQHLADADVVIAFERDHLRYITRVHPTYADRCVLLRDLAERLERSGAGPLAVRVARIAAQPTGDDVVDPGGSDVGVFVRVAHEIVELLDAALQRLGD